MCWPCTGAGTLTFDYPTISEVTGFIMEALESPNASVTPASVANARSSKVDRALIEPVVPTARALSPQSVPAQVAVPSWLQAAPAAVAVMGLSQHRAGQSLAEQTGMFRFQGFEDAIATIPLSRWDVDGEIGTDLPARFGGTVKGVDTFDLQLFSISPAEALLVDPQQRLLLEVRLASATIQNLLCPVIQYAAAHDKNSAGLLTDDTLG